MIYQLSPKAFLRELRFTKVIEARGLGIHGTRLRAQEMRGSCHGNPSCFDFEGL